MNNNGKTFVVSLTTIPGTTLADGTYLLSLDHYLCGNRKICVSDATYPIVANLNATPIGQPVDVGNATFCQETLITGSITYLPYVCGCNCGICPRTENIYCSVCLPCSSNVVPKVDIGTSVAAPTNVQPCCNVTNAVAITTTVNVATA